jgi:hypothetical protein
MAIVAIRGVSTPKSAVSSSTASGNVNFDSGVFVVSPASQSSTVFAGGLQQLTYTGIGGFDAVGHLIGDLAYTLVNSPGQTVSLAFGAEGKFELLAGTVTNAGSVRAGLADVALGATLTTWTGVSIGITDVNGTLNNAKGADFSITDVTGSAIGNGFAYNCQDVSAAKATNFAAFRSQVTAAAGHFCLYSDGNAQSAHAGKFRFGGVTAPTYEVDVIGSGRFSTGVVGTATNDSAGAGYVGEYVSSTVAIGSAVALTTTVVANVTSISLTAGDWDVCGQLDFSNTTVTATQYGGGVSSTSAALGAQDTYFTLPASFVGSSAPYRQPLSTVRVSLAATTTIYLVAQAVFSGGSTAAYGTIRARRIR